MAIGTVDGKLGAQGPEATGVRLRVVTLLVALSAIAPPAAIAVAQPPAAGARQATSSGGEEQESAEQRRERIAAERFLEVLRRRPRTGTALDRLYGYHVQNGSVDQLVRELRTRAEAAAEDGAAWMLLGLVQLRRGEELDATEALQRATEALPEDCMAPYYLGRAHALLGQPDSAAEAMEEALRRSPPRTELLEIGKALGRLYQRQQQPEKASRVWQQLTDQFAGDARVAEAVASILAEEGDHAAALERFTALADSAGDPQRRVQYAIRAAEMKLRLGDKQEARSDLESQLGRLNPDSWLYRDVRRRIEASFTEAADYDGLAAYYADWIAQHPNDVDAMLRAGRTLALQGRLPEAREWFQRAIERAPTDTEPREALVDALVGEEKFAEAADQYEQLHELDADDPDVIIRWGEALLSDRDTPPAERRKRAADVWQRLLERRPDDAVTASQVADLMRAAEQSERAIALYEKAIELAPEAPQYREYLGEYLHRLGRADAALRVWAELAAGPRRNRENLVRLAEVYATFDQPERALETMGEACALDPTLSERLRYAQMLRDAEQYAQAHEQLRRAAPQAETPEERDQVLGEQIAVYQAAGELDEQIDAAREAVAGDDADDPDAWVRFSRLLEADRKYAEAADAAGRALEFAPRSVGAWTIAAELRERAGRYGDALQAYRRLAEIDRRYRTNHLTQIASLNLRLGEQEAALAAGRELLAAGATNPENYRFFADLCFRLGEEEEGLDALRRGVRTAPNDREAILTLARALADQFRTDEAIELYWQAFEAAADLDIKADLVGRLAELYLRSGRFDQLVDRLEVAGRTGRDGDSRREAELLVAAAHEATGDTGTARKLLDALLAASPRDTALLQRLVDLAKRDNDAAAAVEYQRALNRLAPSREGDSRLARLLIDLGEIEQAEAIWMRLSRGEDAEQQLLSTIDGALQRGEWETAVKIAQRLLADQPDDWETLARLAIAYRLSSEHDDQQAAETARRLLALNLPRETLSREAEAQQAQQQASRSPRRGGSTQPTTAASFTTTNAPYLFRPLLAPQANDPFGYRGTTSGFRTQLPNFAMARAAAIAVLFGVAQQADEADGFLDSLETAADASDDDARGELAWWDLDAAVQLAAAPSAANEETAERQLRIAEQLAARFGAEGKLRYVMVAIQSQRPVVRSSSANPPEPEPLPDEILDAIVDSMRQILAEQPDMAARLASMVVPQLVRAGRETEAADLVDRLTAQDLAAPYRGLEFLLAGQLGDRDRLRRLAVHSETDARYAVRALTQLVHAALRRDELEPVFDNDLDMLIDLVATAYERLRPSQRAATSSGSQNIYVQQVAGNRLTPGRQQLEFPPATPVWDGTTLPMLYLLWSLSQEADLEETFLARLQAPAADEESPTRRMVRLAAAAFVLHWSERLEDSEQALAEALAADPGCNALRVVLARLRYDNGDPAGALEAVEAIQPLNSQLVQERELAMLQLAAQLGDRDRARQAARRLYAMRLDTDTQMLLARQMASLGMSDLAGNVMRRIQQRSGQEPRALQEVMRGLQSMGNTDAAAEVAMQLLSRLRAPSSSSNNNEQYLRRQAVEVLVAADRLEPLIERLERQAAAAPQSTRIASELAELYATSGQREKATAILRRLRESGEQTPEALVQMAVRHSQSGEHAQAVESFVAAIKQQPELIGNHFYSLRGSLQVEQGYRILIEQILETGLDKFARSYHYMDTMIREGWEQEENRPVVKRLVIAMFQGGPQMYRTALDTVAGTDELLDDPEAFNPLRDLLLDKTGSGGTDGWATLDGSVSYSTGGHVNGTVTYLARLSEKHPERLGELADRTDRAHRDDPDWIGMRALAGGLAAAANRPQRAAELIEPLLEDERRPLHPTVAWQLGFVCKEHDDLAELAVRLLEHAAETNQFVSDFQYTPKAALIDALHKAGRRDEARQMVLEAINAPDDQQRRGSYPPGYRAQQELRSMQGFAATMLELDFPLDALQLAQQTLEDESLLADARSHGSSLDYYLQRLQKTHDDAEAKLTPEYCLAALEERVAEAIAAEEAAGSEPRDAEPAEKPTPGDRLGALVRPRVAGENLARLRIECLLTDLTRRAAEAEGAEERLRAVAERAASIRDLDDAALPDVVVRAVLAAVTGDDAGLAEATGALPAQLDAFAAENPEGGATAALTAWPAVAAALDRDTPDPDAAALADRLVGLAEAASGENERLALLRERNAIAARHGRAEEAVRHLRSVLALLSDKGDRPRRTKAALSPVDRARRTLELAELAAQQDVPDVSVAAVRGALAEGPPLPAVESELVLGGSGGRRVVTSSSQPPPPISAEEDQVGRLLVRLSRAWRQSEDAVPADAAYEALRDAILPADHTRLHAYLVDPAEPDSGRRPPDADAPIRHESGLAELVDWAVRAGRQAELAAHFQALADAEDTHALGAEVGRILLALQTGPDGSESARFERLAKLLGNHSDGYAAELVGRAAIPAFESEGLAPAAAPLMSELLPRMAAAEGRPRVFGRDDAIPSERLGRRLITLALERGDAEAAHATLLQLIRARHRRNAPVEGYGDRMEKQLLADVVPEFFRYETTVPLAMQLLRRHDQILLPGTQRNPDSMYGKIAEAVKSLPAGGGYEPLRHLFFPESADKPLRLGLEFARRAPVPPTVLAAAKPSAADQPVALRAAPLTGIFPALLAAAERGEALESLIDELRAMHKAGREGADIALALAIDYTDREIPAELLSELGEQIERQVPEGSDGDQRPSLGQIAVAASAARRKATGPLGVWMLEQLRTHCERSKFNVGRAVVADALADTAAEEPDVRPIGESSLWTAASDFAPNHAPVVATRWHVGPRGLTHICGESEDYAFLRLPLAGDYDVTWRQYDGGWNEVGAVVAGVVVTPFGYNDRVSIGGIGSREFRSYKQSIVKKNAANQLTLRVRGATRELMINGQPVYREQRPGTSFPFLGWRAYYYYTTPIEELTVTGAPRVLDEVPLLDDRGLRGWTARQSRAALSPAEVAEPEALEPIGNAQASAAPAVWQWADGELRGAASDEASAQPALLHYSRPLAAGERVRYEFFYAPGECEVHPVLDDVAMVLQPDGVRLRWLGKTRGATDRGPDPDRLLDDPEGQLHEGELPLRSGDWNELELILEDDHLRLELNGTAIYRYRDSASAAHQRRFGFTFQRSESEARVRSAALRGDWPKTFPQSLMKDG